MQAMDNAVDYIRRHRVMFLRTTETAPIELVERILGDALYSGALECTVLHKCDWWIIASTTDWLSGHADYAPEELFQKIIAMPEAGQNAMRGEVLLTAFAQHVITATPHGCMVISGDVSSDDEVWHIVPPSRKWQRMIAFRLG